MFRVPKKTSVWKTHQGSEANALTFAPELIPFIKSKEKTQTFRYASEKYTSMKVGDIVQVRQNYIDEPIGKARLTQIKTVTFAKLPVTQLNQHESYETKEHQRKVLSGYYAFLGREIRDDDLFYIIDFELID